jgi:penicillin-binding protein-related factor A (putative recombinase)
MRHQMIISKSAISTEVVRYVSPAVRYVSPVNYNVGRSTWDYHLINQGDYFHFYYMYYYQN